jgi:hypothetical protein
MKPKQTPKPYRPTEKEVSAVLDLQNFYDWLQIQHECENYESELTKAQLIKQRNAVRNAYKGALLIEKALKDFQFC